MRFKQLFGVSVIVMALAGCSEPEPRVTPSGKNQPATTQNVQPSQAVIANASMPVAANSAQSSQVISPLGASRADVAVATVNGREMVVSADLNFETDNVQKTAVQVEDLVKRHSGFVVFSQVEAYIHGAQSYAKPDGNTLNISRYSHEGSMTVRVPREKATALLKDLEEVIKFLDHQVYKAEDVSFSLRKQALEAQRQKELATRLNALKRTPARHTPETEQAIRDEFDAKARENEAILQQEFWNDKMAFATITMRFRQPEGVLQELSPNLDVVAKQHRPNVGMMAWNGIKQGWDYILMSLIFLLGYWPITVGIPAIWLGMKVMRKVRSRRLTRKLTQAVKTSRHRYSDDEIDDFD